MHIKLLNNAKEIRKAFINRFVMTWEEYQIQRKDWIAKMAKTNSPITENWYKNSFLWDKLNARFSTVSFKDALSFLKEHSGPVYFITEKGHPAYCQLTDFIGESDAQILAIQIEQEWYDGYRIEGRNKYNHNTFLAEDIYVFDTSMDWCVVFTHEFTDWESQNDNPMKSAESRICIIYKG